MPLICGIYEFFWEDCGACKSTQRRDAWAPLHLGQKIHPATRFLRNRYIWLICGHAGGQYLTESRSLWRIWFKIFIWLFAVTVSLFKTSSRLLRCASTSKYHVKDSVSNVFSIAEYCRVLQSNTECYRVLQSITDYHRVLQSVRECHRVSQSVKKCHRVLESVRECYRVLQGIAEYCKVLQSITEFYTELYSITEYNTVLQSITDY